MPPKKVTKGKAAATKKVGFVVDASAVTTTKVAPTKSKKTSMAPAPVKAAAAGVVTAKDVAASKAKAEAKRAPKGTSETAGKKPIEGDEKSGSKKQSKDRRAVPPYRALQLCNLPEVFQEPELRKFLSQFGTSVSSCFVVRTGESNRSRGTAYVRFATDTSEGAYRAILEECHGMLLGGNTVTARYVALRREMPNRRMVDVRRKLDWLNKTRGRKLQQYDASARKPWLKVLKKAAAQEAATNAALAKMGVKYEFHGFGDQLKQVPKELLAAKTNETTSNGSSDKVGQTLQVLADEVQPKAATATPTRPSVRSSVVQVAKAPGSPSVAATPPPKANQDGDASTKKATPKTAPKGGAKTPASAKRAPAKTPGSGKKKPASQ